jgi:hypothetical protein
VQVTDAVFIEYFDPVSNAVRPEREPAVGRRKPFLVIGAIRTPSGGRTGSGPTELSRSR